jgi:predicted transcriptional regulator
MMHVHTVAIPDDIDSQLREIAQREMRRPRDQASIMLIEAIRRASSEPPAGTVAALTERYPELRPSRQAGR